MKDKFNSYNKVEGPKWLFCVNSCNLSLHFTFIIKLFLRSPRGGWIPHVMNSLPYGKNCLFFHREMSKKRKVMEKTRVQVTIRSDPSNGNLIDDGFSWRKYGRQKACYWRNMSLVFFSEPTKSARLCFSQ